MTLVELKAEAKKRADQVIKKNRVIARILGIDDEISWFIDGEGDEPITEWSDDTLELAMETAERLWLVCDGVLQRTRDEVKRRQGR